jgi:hypothetical protein
MFKWINNIKNKKEKLKEDCSEIYTMDHISSLFLYAGYKYSEIIQYVNERLNCIYKAFSDTDLFDFLDIDVKKLNDTDKIEILSDDCSHGFPSIRNIIEFAYFPQEYLNDEIKTKIDYIMSIILDDRYQRLGDVRLAELLGKRFGCFTGWTPHLPGYYSLDLKGQQASRLILWLDIMSHFKTVQQSSWFKNCINHLESFRTTENTYCFPKEYLKNEKSGYYITGFFMGLEESRNKKSIELESSFRMLFLKKRIQEE